jgi:hypothetical protein
MATVNPSITYATNSTTQNLFAIYQIDGVTSYGTIGLASVVSLDTAQVSVGANIEYNTGRGEWTLFGNANTAYTFTASVTTRNVNPDSTYAWYDTISGNVIGTTAQVGQPLTVSYFKDTANAAVVSLTIVNANSENFQYPAQIVNASASITEVSGYEA